MMMRTLTAVCLVLGFLSATAAAQDDTGWRDIEISTKPLELKRDGGDGRVGKLVYAGGLVLRADDREFGGLSGLHVSADEKQLLAVTDKGQWLSADLTWDEDDRLANLGAGRMAPILDAKGRPLGRKVEKDAEGLHVAGGTATVAFEIRHKIWRYNKAEDGRFTFEAALDLPPGLTAAPSNGALEALTQLPDGGLLAMSEGLMNGNGGLTAWIGGDAAWEPFYYKPEPEFGVTDAVATAAGWLYVLERAFSPSKGVRARVTRLPLDSIKPNALIVGEELARLAAGVSVDNFEGLAVIETDGAPTRLFLLSDDNFNPLQRTLLMAFDVMELPSAEAGQGPDNPA